MNKFLVYTSNLAQNPRSMRDVIRFAEETPKFYITNVELNAHLKDVKAGDNIITSKGNSAYVIRTFDSSLEDLSTEDRKYIDRLTREFGMKKANISGVSHVIKFETWCKDAAPIFNSGSTKTTKKAMKENSISNLTARLKERFMPVEAKDVRIATDGNICVETAEGFVSIDANGNLTSYPTELTFALPVYIISKPTAQLVEGDVICRDGRYYKITKIADGKLSTIGYNGVGHSVKTITDFVLGAAERVVVSLAGNLGGQGINPMLLLAMSSKEDGKSSFDSLLPLMLMSQQGGAVNMGANPMLMLALCGDKEGGDGINFKDLAMMSMLGGGNLFGQAPAAQAGGLFGGLFGQAPVAAPAAPKAARKAPAKKAAKAAEAAE